MRETVDIAPDVGVTPQLTFHILSREEEFVEIREEWNELVKSSSATIFQTHEWLSLWWQFYGKSNQSLHCLLIREEGVLVGIVPLYSEKFSFLGITFQRRFGMLGEGIAYPASSGYFFDDGPSDYLDAIVRTGYERRAGRLVLEYFCGTGKYSAVDFVNAPENGVIMGHIVPQLNGGHRSVVKAADACPYIPVPASMEDFFSKLSASVRRRMRQARRGWEEGPGFVIAEAITLEERRRALDAIRDLHQKRWNRVGFPGLFADERFAGFQSALLEKFHERGWLWCKTAMASGECVGARMAFRFKDCYYDYLSGFDDNSDAARRRPGLALLLSMIEDAALDGSREVDLLRGDEEYKFDLTDHIRRNSNVTIEKGVNFLSKSSQLFRFGKFLARREGRLLGVQYREKPFLRFAGDYVKFRLPRWKKKISGQKHA